MLIIACIDAKEHRLEGAQCRALLAAHLAVGAAGRERDPARMAAAAAVADRLRAARAQGGAMRLRRHRNGAIGARAAKGGTMLLLRREAGDNRNNNETRGANGRVRQETTERLDINKNTVFG